MKGGSQERSESGNGWCQSSKEMGWNQAREARCTPWLIEQKTATQTGGSWGDSGGGGGGGENSRRTRKELMFDPVKKVDKNCK